MAPRFGLAVLLGAMAGTPGAANHRDAPADHREVVHRGADRRVKRRLTAWQAPATYLLPSAWKMTHAGVAAACRHHDCQGPWFSRHGLAEGEPVARHRR
jgi:hypothetical protein